MAEPIQIHPIMHREGYLMAHHFSLVSHPNRTGDLVMRGDFDVRDLPPAYFSEEKSKRLAGFDFGTGASGVVLRAASAARRKQRAYHIECIAGAVRLGFDLWTIAKGEKEEA